MYDEQNAQKKAELAEKFITDYKESELIGQAYTMLVGAYAKAQNWTKVMDAADRTVAYPKADDKNEGFRSEQRHGRSAASERF